MFTKYKLQQIGYDALDHQSGHVKLIDSIAPFGPSRVREAYAFGISLMLNLNAHFRSYHEEVGKAKKKVRIPHFLHLVIASEHEPDREGAPVSLNDLKLLQRELLEDLKTEDVPSTNFSINPSRESFSSGYVENHTTVFIPYHSPSKESPLDTEQALLLAQLGSNGKKRGIRNERKLRDYLHEKIEVFMQDDPAARSTYLRALIKKQGGDFLEEDLDSFDMEVEIVHVITISVACSNPMSDRGTWQPLAQALKEELSALAEEQEGKIGKPTQQRVSKELKNRTQEEIQRKLERQTNVLIGLNFFNDHKRVPASSYDRLDPLLFKQYLSGSKSKSFYKRDLFLEDLSKIKVGELTNLSEEQLQARRAKWMENSINTIRLIIKAICLAISIMIMVEIHKIDSDSRPGISNDCMNRIGDMIPMQIQTISPGEVVPEECFPALPENSAIQAPDAAPPDSSPPIVPEGTTLELYKKGDKLLYALVRTKGNYPQVRESPFVADVRSKKADQSKTSIPPPQNKALVDMLDGYHNVNDEFEAYFLIYVILNVFHIIALLLQLKFKSNKGILARISQLYLLMPIVNFLFIVVIIWARFEFTTQVCFCDYKDSYYSLHPDDSFVEPHNYLCLNDLRSYTNSVIWIELGTFAVFFAAIVYHYYTNVFDIKLKEGVISYTTRMGLTPARTRDLLLAEPLLEKQDD